MAIALARRPAGNPAGGQFAEHTRSDSPITLNRHTPVLGWDLRGYTTSGSGTHGEAWSAILHFDGTASVIISDAGAGFGPELEALSGGSTKALEEAARTAGLSADDFIDVLRVSAEADRTSRTERLTRVEVVEMLASLGEINHRSRDLLLLT